MEWYHGSTLSVEDSELEQTLQHYAEILGQDSITDFMELRKAMKPHDLTIKDLVEMLNEL